MHVRLHIRHHTEHQKIWIKACTFKLKRLFEFLSGNPAYIISQTSEAYSFFICSRKSVSRGPVLWHLLIRPFFPWQERVFSNSKANLFSALSLSLANDCISFRILTFQKDTFWTISFVLFRHLTATVYKTTLVQVQGHLYLYTPESFPCH